MEENKCIKDQYETLIQNAAKTYLNKQYPVALNLYNEALTLANQLKASKMAKSILKYMMSRCLLESNKLEDISEAVMILQNLEKSTKNRLPAVYCLLAQAHCKLFRYDCALDVINEGNTFYSKNPLLEKFYIPGTSIIIEQNENERTWLKIKQECSTWHKPDAICSLQDCRCITAPYVTPNKNIFLRDPAFTGMVIISCNNKQRACILKFHLYCWKFKKDQMYPIKKVSDKDIIGHTCFTPNCNNGDIPCTISSIEIIGQNGELKTHIKNTAAASSPLNKISSKGAIKKVKAQILKKVKEIALTEHHLPTSKQAAPPNKKIDENVTYDANLLLCINDEINGEDVTFSDESTDIINEKNWLFSFFYYYIQNNKVTVSDVYKKFTDINADMILKNIDIVKFLLSTKKIEILSNEENNVKNNTITHDEQQTLNIDKIQDVDDIYYELMNNNHTGCKESQLHKVNQNNDIQDCHDFMIKDNEHNSYKFTCTENQCSANSVYQTPKDTKNTLPLENEFEQKDTENIKLREYINQQNIKMKEMMEQLCELNNNLKDKDSLIKSLKNEIETCLQKMEIYKSLHETITDFQKKYDSVKYDNIQMKKELIESIRENKELKMKLLECNSPKIKRQEWLQQFREEYKILENCINSDWEKKMEESLQKEIKSKLTLINKFFRSIYMANRNLLNGYHDQCVTTLEVIDTINQLMEKIINTKNYINNSEWLTRLSIIRKVIADHQNDYVKRLEQLHSAEDPESFNTDINLSGIPNPPQESLINIVENALNEVHQQTLQNFLKMSLSTHPMAYPMPMNMPMTPPYYPKYPQQYQYTQPFQSPVFNSTIRPPLLMTPPPSQAMNPNAWRPQFNQTPVQQSPQYTNKQHFASNVNITEEKEYSIGNKDTQKSVESTIAVTDNSNIKEMQNTVKENIDIHEKINQVRKVFETLNLKDQTEKNNFKEKQIENVKKNVNDETFESDDKVTEDHVYFEDDTLINSKVKDSKNVKKVGKEGLLKILHKRYPGSLESDIIEIISEIRDKHKNSLSGISIKQIIKESDTYYSRHQQLHMFRYFLNDGNDSTAIEATPKVSDTQKQDVFKVPISPMPSSANSINTSEVESARKKKTWKPIIQEEVKWSATGEKECSICMSLVNKNTCYTLSCQHTFHKQCIKLWLKSDRSCPNCRVAVTEEDEFPPLPS